MVFSSSFFLFAFLPAFLVGYYALPVRWRNAWALAGSLWFYAFGEPRFVYVLVGTTIVDWWISVQIARAGDPKVRRRWLVADVALNLGLLGWCKYAGFAAAQLDAMLAWFGVGGVAWTGMALPIGISFFVFQKITYVVDVYRRTAAPAPTAAHCLLYVVLFPQLIAGPIVRYRDVARQLVERVHSAERFWRGVERFAQGLFKKAVIADGMAALCDPVHAAPIDQVSAPHAWIAAFAYYFQIYFDFSGYSDMAIGLGRMIGFEFLENFDRPYAARTFTEFWRRWHISLSNFMRDYLYLPIGGNRTTPLRAYRNLWIVFFASGLWHGAAWHFVVWGAWQGVFLTSDRLFWSRAAERVPAVVLRVAMVLLVTLSWVMFRSADLGRAADFYACMFGGGADPWTTPLARHFPFDAWAVLLFAVAAAVCFLPWSQRYLRCEQRALAFGRTARGAPIFTAVVWLVLLVAAMAVVGGRHSPFIYFQF